MPATDISGDFALAFNDLRTELLGVNAKLVLLEEDGETHAFNDLQIITTGWYPEYSTFFGNSTFHVADVTAATAKNIRKASFVVIRDANLVTYNNVLFEMKSDTAPPDSNIPWWRIRAEYVSRKYVPPEEI